MIQAWPITEPEVLSELNAGRFLGELEGCVVMEEARYLGHVLFCRKGEEAVLLDSAPFEKDVLDFALRACLAQCFRKGAICFSVRNENESLRAFFEEHGINGQKTILLAPLFQCKSDCNACQ